MVLGLRRRRRESQPDPVGAAKALAGHFDSQLLALLFEQHQLGDPLHVLDVGPAAGDTVAFLSRYRCHLHCADLYDEPDLLAPCAPDELAERTRQLRTVLTQPEIPSYDICLFWDLFRCMHPTVLPALGQALAPVVDGRTLAHAFVSHGRVQAGERLAVRSFAIAADSRANYRSCSHPHLEPQDISQREVVDKLGCFEVDKSRLLQGGLLEMVMQGTAEVRALSD